MQTLRLSARSCARDAAVSRPMLNCRHRVISCRAEPETGSKSGTSAKADDDEVPAWVRREEEKKLQDADPDSGLPFGILLLGSIVVAIAAVGSAFEYANQGPIFGQIGPDSPLYTPILGVFAITGLPTSGWLFFKSVESANKAADRMDRVDGY